MKHLTNNKFNGNNSTDLTFLLMSSVNMSNILSISMSIFNSLAIKLRHKYSVMCVSTLMKEYNP